MTDAASPATGLVMVIDDSPMVRELLQCTLEDAGRKVVTAESGEAAVELAGVVDVDALVCDLSMPGLNGVETYAALQPLIPDVAVVFSSGRPPDAAVEELLEQSHVTFLQKPYGAAELFACLDEVTRYSASQRAARVR